MNKTRPPGNSMSPTEINVKPLATIRFVRQGKIRQDKTAEDKTRPNRTGQDKIRQ